VVWLYVDSLTRGEWPGANLKILICCGVFDAQTIATPWPAVDELATKVPLIAWRAAALTVCFGQYTF